MIRIMFHDTNNALQLETECISLMRQEQVAFLKIYKNPFSLEWNKLFITES